MPGGWAAQRWGGRSTLTLSFVLWSTASLLTPVNAQSSAPVAAARVLVGVSQGLLIPSIHTVLASVITPAAPRTPSFSHCECRRQMRISCASVPSLSFQKLLSRAAEPLQDFGWPEAVVPVLGPMPNAVDIRCHIQSQTLQWRVSLLGSTRYRGRPQPQSPGITSARSKSLLQGRGWALLVCASLHLQLDLTCIAAFDERLVGRAPQCIPPKERATAVSLTTSGMYMGSAAAIQWMPGVAMRYGAAAITRLNGCLGLAWVVLWFWAGRLLPPRCVLLLQMCNESFTNTCRASQMRMCI